MKLAWTRMKINVALAYYPVTVIGNRSKQQVTWDWQQQKNIRTVRIRFCFFSNKEDLMNSYKQSLQVLFELCCLHAVNYFGSCCLLNNPAHLVLKTIFANCSKSNIVPTRRTLGFWTSSKQNLLSHHSVTLSTEATEANSIYCWNVYDTMYV